MGHKGEADATLSVTSGSSEPAESSRNERLSPSLLTAGKSKSKKHVIQNQIGKVSKLLEGVRQGRKHGKQASNRKQSSVRDAAVVDMDDNWYA
jgi:hypothetical protein